MEHELEAAIEKIQARVSDVSTHGLAKQLDLPRSTIGRFKSGEGFPLVGTLLKLARHFDEIDAPRSAFNPPWEQEDQSQ